MKDDLDKKLYNEYLQGNKEAFDILYLKYKDKIQYYIFNIIKDYQKAEDITQEVFIYVLKNELKENYSFKYYIYLVAQSRAIAYINVENRRKEIAEKYVYNKDVELEKDVLETIEKQETQKEILDIINKLEGKYRNAIYLVKIEGLSYKETANIMGQSVQNIKNLVHRGKKEMKKYILKDKNYSVYKVVIISLLVITVLSGAIYASIKIYNQINKAQITPNYTDVISQNDSNKVWIGTFNLVWNDFMNDVIGGKIEFEDGDSALADELNRQAFTVEQLNSNSYFKIHGIENFELKNKIEQEIKNKFNEESEVLDECNWENKDGYVLYAMLKKQFNYLEKFPTLKDDKFKNSEEKVKYFGIEKDTNRIAAKNVEILYYNSKEDFAIKLLTKEGEEVYLYKTSGVDKTFEQNYLEMLDKSSKYNGDKYLDKKDVLKIPYIKVKENISYDELCNKRIKGSKWRIDQALQTIDFELNNYGGTVKSEALIEATKQSIFEKGKELLLNDTFILFLKEEDKNQPYFALRVDNTGVLVKSE